MASILKFMKWTESLCPSITKENSMQRRTLAAGAAMAALLMMAGQTTAAPATVTVTARDAAGNPLSVTVPRNPQRVAVADFAALDTLDAWGIGKQVVALTKTQQLPYLAEYFKKGNGIIDLGSLREIDFEALMGAEPDVIIISGRLRKKFADLERIAPVIYLPIDWQNGVFDSFAANTRVLATIFGKEAEAEAAIARLKGEMDDIARTVNQRTALVGMVTSAHVNLLGDKARCSLIGHELGFNNLAKGANTTHGSEASFEYLLKLDPEYFFVLDRDSAIGRQGAKLAADVLDNELIAATRAKKEGKIVFLNPQAWYLGEGGIQSMEVMLSDIRRALEK